MVMKGNEMKRSWECYHFTFESVSEECSNRKTKGKWQSKLFRFLWVTSKTCRKKKKLWKNPRFLNF